MCSLEIQIDHTKVLLLNSSRGRFISGATNLLLGMEYK